MQEHPQVHVAGFSGDWTMEPIVILRNGHGVSLSDHHELMKVIASQGPVICLDQSDQDLLSNSLEGNRFLLSNKTELLMAEIGYDTPFIIVDDDPVAYRITGYDPDHPDQPKRLILLNKDSIASSEDIADQRNKEMDKIAWMVAIYNATVSEGVKAETRSDLPENWDTTLKSAISYHDVIAAIHLVRN
ncbi:hypothetical protein DMZ48_14885 [Robertkochia solimangrovi]|nr:hypothetical protein DMZ48_14885 [Robertkochia solimangrovi]